MRAYLFTPRERTAIVDFLTGKIRASDDSIRMVLSRFRSFKDLSSDVELYFRLREAVATDST